MDLISDTTTLLCPFCDSGTEAAVASTVNAQHQPQLRQDIIHGRLQLHQCEHCGYAFRSPPRFNYMDLSAGQFIGVWPVEETSRWVLHEARTRRACLETTGVDVHAKQRRAKLRLRTVFGWPALVEKLLAQDAGIDDVTLEIAKAQLMSEGEGIGLTADHELRLVRFSGEYLYFDFLDPISERVQTSLQVPRVIVDDVDSSFDGCRELQETLSKGPFVDLRRGLCQEAFGHCPAA